MGFFIGEQTAEYLGLIDEIHLKYVNLTWWKYGDDS